MSLRNLLDYYSELYDFLWRNPEQKSFNFTPGQDLVGDHIDWDMWLGRDQVPRSRPIILNTRTAIDRKIIPINLDSPGEFKVIPEKLLKVNVPEFINYKTPPDKGYWIESQLPILVERLDHWIRNELKRYKLQSNEKKTHGTSRRAVIIYSGYPRLQYVRTSYLLLPIQTALILPSIY